MERDARNRGKEVSSISSKQFVALLLLVVEEREADDVRVRAMYCPFSSPV
jgi:hypothetical protein